MRRVTSARAMTILAAAVLAALSIVALASAELTQKGNLFIRFDGGISPEALPRTKLAPVAVRFEGTIRVLKGDERPKLQRIEIALNRKGKLDVQGLPICRRSQLVSTDANGALAACGSALVGSGGVVAFTELPGQPNHLLRGELLLFNTVEDGRPAILAYIFEPTPPITSFVTFEIKRQAGTFGTVITADFSSEAQRKGYLKSIFLRLQRRYTYRGRPRTYLSAVCAAAPGFSQATFPFAKASMKFDDGRVLSSTITRSCRVKG